MAAVAVLIGAGAVVLVYLRLRGRPLLFLLRVCGDSMLPTFADGTALLFWRGPFKVGSVVAADVAEDIWIVKRVKEIHPGRFGAVLLLLGDNSQVSATYWARAQDLKGVYVCRLWRGR